MILEAEKAKEKLMKYLYMGKYVTFQRACNAIDSMVTDKSCDDCKYEDGYSQCDRCERQKRIDYFTKKEIL